VKIMIDTGVIEYIDNCMVKFIDLIFKQFERKIYNPYQTLSQSMITNLDYGIINGIPYKLRPFMLKHNKNYYPSLENPHDIIINLLKIYKINSTEKGFLCNNPNKGVVELIMHNIEKDVINRTYNLEWYWNRFCERDDDEVIEIISKNLHLMYDLAWCGLLS